MEPTPASRGVARLANRETAAAVTATTLTFLLLYWSPFSSLVRAWWRDPEAAHGLLLGPLSLVLAWRRGLVAQPRPQKALGLLILGGAVVLRYVAGLGAELYTLRMSVVTAVVGLIVIFAGVRQVLRWWLPIVLVGLSVPIPDVLLGSLALPLQLKASQFGVHLLEWRQVPVRLSGTVIAVAGRSLAVTEACSGLRALTALLASGVLIGGVWLRSPWTRVVLVLATIPVAVVVNGFRVFLTGFLGYFVSPELGEGSLSHTEGWILFVAAFAIIGGVAWVLTRSEEVLGWRSGP